MATIREKRNSVPALANEGVAAKRRHTTAGQEKENLTPCGRSSGTKKPRLATDRISQNPAISQLQEKIELEYKIRDGATKLLQASNNTTQSMEASKGLFVSNAKIIALMRELQQLQTDAGGKTERKTPAACPAKLAISEIRIPLEWQEFESTQGKVDSHAHFGVFCLFRSGNQVMDTPSLVQVDRSTMDINFRDTIIFPSKVDADFTLEVEVYCSLPPEEAAAHHKPSTPIRMLKKFRGNKDRTEESPAPSLAHIPSSSSSYHDLASSIPPYRFALAGHAHLTISEISQSCRTYVLKRGAVGSSGTASTGGHEVPLLPLWGQICCKLMAQPDCATESRMTGFINMQRMVSGLPDWMRLWCVMRQNRMRCWKNPEDVGRKMPEQVIELSEGMSVEPAPRLLMRRPNALLLKDQKSEFYVAFESKEERQQWMDTTQQALLDLRVWKSLCDFIIPLPNSKFYVDSPSTQLRAVPKLTAFDKKGIPSHTQL